MKKKLRQEVARLMKEKGLGKLYAKSANQARKGLTTFQMRKLLRILEIKPGDIVNDCDGFNHVIKEIHLETHTTYNGINYVEHTVVFESGRFSCGCGSEFQPALPPEVIDRYHRAYMHDEHLIKQGWINPDSWMFKCWEEGKMVCDENGFSRQKEYE